MIRSFIAFELMDRETIDNIVSFGSRLKQNQQKIKLVSPENLHVTLKFFGNITETLAPKIYKIISEEINEKLIYGKRLEYSLKGAGQFNRYSVIWIKIIGDIEFLQHVKSTTEDLLFNELGIDRDKRKEFKPHLTIARLKKERINYKNFETFKKIINENKQFTFGSFSIAKIKLKKSQLTPKGPIYSDLVF